MCEITNFFYAITAIPGIAHVHQDLESRNRGAEGKDRSPQTIPKLIPPSQCRRVALISLCSEQRLLMASDWHRITFLRSLHSYRDFLRFWEQILGVSETQGLFFQIIH
jgi:hypothetical protein